ncbi:heterokaryon incompatibility protein-domain-containing protein [Tricladium varicosporioides]|nr:heterokaryon incompatibility protein-domain-containing protein [Hymenoscyphus varicosporioides]
MPTNSIYSPLSEDEDEVRLITIAPYVPRLLLVECTLETLSLKAFTLEYRNFSSNSKCTGRKRVVEWNHVRNTLHSTTPNNIMLDKHNPDYQDHRFIWGDYAALSYVWGDPADTEAIILNGRKLLVQRNLEVALRSFSSRAEFHSRYRLWVDAICINQNDMEEKSRQIRNMRTVYGDASEVVAWLGEEKDNSSKAFDLIQVFNDARTKGHGQLLEERLREDYEYLGFGCWKALHDLLQRKYWSRLWIIQEVVLGSSSAVVCCGARSVSWRTFCQAIGFLFEYLWTVKDPIFIRESYTGSPNAQVIWETASAHLVFRDLWVLSRNEEDSGYDHLSFGQLLDLGKSGNCQDSKDKVYGLIGMMDPLVATKIIPDYTLSPSKVYAAIAKTFVCTHGNLDAIREGNPWGKMGAPSWAADWTWEGRIRHARVTAWINGPFWRPKGLPPDYTLGLPFRACGRKRMDAYFSDNGWHLTCRGFLVDEVDGLSAREYGYFNWAENTIHQPKSNRNAYGNSEEVIKALYRTLVLDRAAGGVRASQRHAAILTMPSEFVNAAPQFIRLGWTWLSNQGMYYFRWSGWRLANRKMMVLGKYLDEYFSEFIPSDANEFDHTEAYSCNNRTSQGRRFITTMNGYMGWAPDNMFDSDQNQVQPGDKIAILFGCSTPIVVRSQNGYFQVLGEAYIHGLMDGEALAFLESGQCQDQYFTFY